MWLFFWLLCSVWIYRICRISYIEQSHVRMKWILSKRYYCDLDTQSLYFWCTIQIQISSDFIKSIVRAESTNGARQLNILTLGSLTYDLISWYLTSRYQYYRHVVNVIHLMFYPCTPTDLVDLNTVTYIVLWYTPIF